MAIRRSHQSASSTPPARHQPSTAAIAGLDGVSRVEPIGPSGWSTSRSIAFRSAPAQKASPPAPVRTRTRAPSSASKSLEALRAKQLGRRRRRPRCGARAGRSSAPRRRRPARSERSSAHRGRRVGSGRASCGGYDSRGSPKTPCSQVRPGRAASEGRHSEPGRKARDRLGHAPPGAVQGNKKRPAVTLEACPARSLRA